MQALKTKDVGRRAFRDGRVFTKCCQEQRSPTFRTSWTTSSPRTTGGKCRSGASLGLRTTVRKLSQSKIDT